VKRKKFLAAAMVIILFCAVNFSAVGCAPSRANSTAGGALDGAATGAAAGAIIGALSGHAPGGALIGALAGAFFSGLAAAAQADNTKEMRAAGQIVPPPPAGVSNYQPWYENGGWCCHDNANRQMWWNEGNETWMQ